MVRPSMRCVVHVAPDNCPEFQALCDSLQRNDPTVTTITTDRSTTPAGYGRQLGEALLSNNNSVVSEIDLYLSFLLLESDRQGQTTTDATALVAWMEQASSLQTIALHSRYGTSYDRYERIEPIVLQQLLNAMKKNPNIQVFHSFIDNFSLPVVSQYLSSSNRASMLKSLRIEIPNTTSVRDWEQAAHAIAGLSSLKELSLSCSIEFLKLLPAHSTLLLRELHAEFTSSPLEVSEMVILSSIMSSSKDLQQVSMRWAFLNGKTWGLVRSGLQSNPSIIHLKLESCSIAPDASSMFMNHFQSNGMASYQNLRSLDLSDLEIAFLSNGGERFDRLSHLAQMLCGSLLQHVTFAFHGTHEDAVAEFFEILSINSSTVRLRSMHLKGQLLWDMSSYLSSTVHLRHFTFTFDPEHGDDDDFAVPSTFLHSLLRNGSLYTVEFKNRRGQLYIPSEGVSRFIQGCTTRNRELSSLIKSSFHTAASTEATMSDASSHGSDTAPVTSKTRTPTLCLASQQTPATAPNAMMRGLLAFSDTLATEASGSLPGKRVASAALEDVSL